VAVFLGSCPVPLPTRLPGAPSERAHPTRAARLWLGPLTANLSRVLAEGPTKPPVTADRGTRRSESRKRRLPTTLLVVPVVLIGLGVALFLVLGGDGGGIIGGGDDDSDVVPEFDFAVGGARAVATAPDPDTESLEAEAEDLAVEITPTLDELYTNAFLDPANWREGDYGEVIELFSEGAASTAQQSVEVLTLGATAGEVYERVTPERGRILFTVLFDPAGSPDTAVATVHFSALGERSDGTFNLIVSKGELFLRDLGGWTITAFDMTREDREVEPPPSPAPSGSATPS
jgi:hypothetical protein